MGREISGTDAQILTRLYRGDSFAAIRDELGCSNHRIRRLASERNIQTREPILRRHKGEQQVQRQARMRPTCVYPQMTLSLLEGWLDVIVDYPADDDGVITIRKVKQ